MNPKQKLINERQSKILKIIVEQYIKSANPVSSKTILQLFTLDCSSATIRNECAVLEEMELLEKAHSSSGRIPSTRGYRYYVDNLMTKSDDDSLDVLKAKVTELFANRNIAFNEVLNKTSSIISEMTNLVSVVIGPNIKNDTLKQIEVIPLGPENALAVFITSHGHLENKMFNFKDVSHDDLAIATKIFNSRLQGTKISQLMEKFELLRPILSQQIQKSEHMVESFVNTLISFSQPYAATHGVQYMLEKPEFSDVNKVKTILKFIDSQSPWEYFENQNDNKIHFKIGDELGATNQDLALITTTFTLNDGEKGQIAVMGPKRLEYEKISEIFNWMNEIIRKKES